MDINNLTVQTKYEIISDQLGVMTVAFLMKGAGIEDWSLCSVVAGESYDMLHRLENFN